MIFYYLEKYAINLEFLTNYAMKERMQRFNEYMKRKGINDNQVTVNCGLAQGLLGKCRTGASDLGARTIDKILNFYQDLSRKWLIAGAGEMLVQDNIQQGSGNTNVGNHSINGNNNNTGDAMEAILKLTKMLEQERAEKEEWKQKYMDLFNNKV
jgi:hypothetical protein